MIKVGFLLSAGGSAFEAAVRLSEIVSENLHVVVDRDCGAADKARRLGIKTEFVAEQERSAFSDAAFNAFRAAGCELICLHFSRLVSSDLFEKILTVNVHPALLPAFPGLDGVGDAHLASAPLQGATLHLVDPGIDTGPVLTQTVYPVAEDADLDWRHRLAYRQKVIVTLALLDWAQAGRINPARRGREAFDFNGLSRDTLCAPGFVSDALKEKALALLAEMQAGTA